MDGDSEANDEKKGVLSCESATGPFICGACDENVHSICSLHAHMLGKHSDGSYHYDNLIRTAFPKYDSCCIGTQTSKMDKMYLKQYRRSRKGKPPKYVYKKNMNSIVGKNYIVCKLDENHDEHGLKDKPLDDDDNVKQNVRKHDTHSRHNFRRITQLDGLRDCSVALDPVSITEFDNKLEIANENIQVSNNKITVDIPHSKYDHRAIDNDGNIEGKKEDTTSPSSDALTDVVVKTEPDIASSGNTFDMGLLSHDFNDDWDDGASVDIPIMNDDVPDDDSGRIASQKIESNENNDSKHGVFSSTNHNMKRINAIQSDHTNNNDGIIPATKRTRTHISKDYRDRGDTSEEDVDNHPIVRKKEKTLKRKYKKKTSKETKDKSQVVKQIRTKASKKGSFICHICGIQLRNQRRDAHMKKHLKKQPVEPSRYICDVCGLTLVSTHGLQHHKLRHDSQKGIGEFRCSECPRVFIVKDEYAAHMNFHSGARPYMCTQCDNGYGSVRNMKRHVRRVHDKVANWTCDVCGNKYHTKYHLSDHYARNHMAPSLPCKYCGRLFKSTGVRQNHEFTHTGEKRYTCRVCKHGFIQWTPFLGHMMKQHGFSREETLKVKKWNGENVDIVYECV